MNIDCSLIEPESRQWRQGMALVTPIPAMNGMIHSPLMLVRFVNMNPKIRASEKLVVRFTAVEAIGLERAIKSVLRCIDKVELPFE